MVFGNNVLLYFTGDNYVIYARQGKGQPPPVPERTVFRSPSNSPEQGEEEEEDLPLPPPPPPLPSVSDIQELPLPPPPFDPQEACSCSTLTRKSNPYRTKSPHVHFNLDQNTSEPSCAYNSGKTDQIPKFQKHGNYLNMTRNSQGQIRVMSPSNSSEDSRDPRSRVTRPGSASSRSGDSLADETSTTSGSYPIDPDELCREIDDLFFSDTVV